jgi:hydroxymethylbilane synthase
MKVVIGARASPLSLAQVREVKSLLEDLEYELKTFVTTGDLDQKTSLRSLDKTNFFTKELDEALLKGVIRVAIHSAKDLPDPLPQGLKVVALTKGVSPLDSLVIKTDLSEAPLIATSSFKREEAVLKVFPQARFTDIRGTIEERLKKLDDGSVEGVVIAEAALIRLGLTGRKRIFLPGETTRYQGQLALLAREEDIEIHTFFSRIDGRKKISFGLSRPSSIDVIHLPLIDTLPVTPSFEGLEEASHIIFTSKTAVSLFSSYKKKLPKVVMAIGEATGKEVFSSFGITPLIAKEATQEGVISLLETLNIEQLFWPRSEGARGVITDWAEKRGVSLFAPVWYKTVTREKIPSISLKNVEELFFTSPSTVEAYLFHFGTFDGTKTVRSIGPVTEKTVDLHRLLTL